MKLVVDANRIVSAFLRDGSTRRAILTTRSSLVAPDVLREELARHIPVLAERIGVTPDELTSIAALLLERIEWIGETAYRSRLEEARKAMELVDPNDVPYLACALAVDADAIWSLDRHFDRQSLVRRVHRPDDETP